MSLYVSICLFVDLYGFFPFWQFWLLDFLIFQEMKETKPEKTGHVCCESCEFLPKA